MALTYARGLNVGSLVRVREREWVVLFLDDQDVLSLRPLSGSDSETCGVHLALEGDSIEPASFPCLRRCEKSAEAYCSGAL